MHIESSDESKHWHNFTSQWVYKIFLVHIKIKVTDHLKHSNIWLSADAIPMLNDLVHAMPWQCMVVFSMCMYVYVHMYLYDSMSMAVTVWRKKTRVKTNP